MATSKIPAVSSSGDPPAGGSATTSAVRHPLGRLPVTLEPDRNLLKYYMLTALLFGPALMIAAVPLWFRFRTLRYDVDEEGITMRWGILFRREVSLTYARIQDIQLTSNVVERWLGLGRIQLQTASGSATAEMTIEGRRDVDAIRDFLYSRMRGVQDEERDVADSARTTDVAAHHDVTEVTERTIGAIETGTRAADAASRPAPASNPAPAALAADVAALAATLDAVAAEMRAIRETLTRTPGAPGRTD